MRPRCMKAKMTRPASDARGRGELARQSAEGVLFPDPEVLAGRAAGTGLLGLRAPGRALGREDLVFRCGCHRPYHPANTCVGCKVLSTW